MQNEVIGTFQCSYTFSVNKLNYFVINGYITEGQVNIGQYINFFCAGYNKILKLKISGVQFVHYAKNLKNKFDISVECDSLAELTTLDKIEMTNEIGFVTNH